MQYRKEFYEYPKKKGQYPIKETLLDFGYGLLEYPCGMKTLWYPPSGQTERISYFIFHALVGTSGWFKVISEEERRGKACAWRRIRD